MVMPECVPHNCGKKFRASLKKPSPNYPHGCKTRKPRFVPAFTVQAMQRNTKVIPPPKSGVFDQRPIKPTVFRQCYMRGEFPVTIEYTNRGKRLGWKVPIENLDFHHYLPMFFDGLAEAAYPYSFIVEQGIKDLVAKGSYKILPVIPQLIIPIRNALSTKRPNVISYTLTCIQSIVKGSDRVGEALVPYYRQILPILNLFKMQSMKGESKIRESLEKNIGDLIEDTLNILELHGGPDAYINIKYLIPTYESCTLN